MVYLNLDKKFVDKNLADWNKEAIVELGEEDGANTYYYTDDAEAIMEEFDEDSDKITVSCNTSKLGYLSVDVKLDTEDLLHLIEIATRKLNKFKAILESLK